MPSIGSFKAQPLTRTFAVTQAPGAEGGETGAAYFTQARVDAWAAANADDVTKVSEGLYIITGSFGSTIDALNPNGSFDIRRSLLDLGKEVIIGNAAQSRLIVLRKVQNIRFIDETGGGQVGYVVIENNYRSANWPTPDDSDFNVAVARC
jgi:hypothetical protein